MAYKEEINQVLKRINSAILILSETRMTADIDESEVNVPGCNIIRCDTENRYIRRIMLYVRSDIKHK